MKQVPGAISATPMISGFSVFSAFISGKWGNRTCHDTAFRALVPVHSKNKVGANWNTGGVN